jgi:outer membrane protein TolC
VRLISGQVEQLAVTVSATARLVDAREAARADLLLAQAALTQAKTLQAQADAELIHARAALVLLSGLLVEGASAPETVPTQAPPPAALILAQAEQASAEANRRALARSQWDNPSLGLDVTSEKDTRGTERSNRFGLTLSVPLGRSPAAKREAIDAGAALTAAAARTAQVERETQSAIDQARAALEAAEAQAALGVERAKTLTEVRDLYEQGRRERAVSIFDLIRARDAALAAELDAFEARIAVDAATSRLAQALGVLP